MPLYKPIPDKQLTVVLDIGAAYTKFGFAAEFAPRNIIRSEVRCRTTGALRKVWDFKSEQDLYDILVDFIHNIYFKYALLSPKDRAIVVVESLLCPTLFRETLAKVLFIHYEIGQLFILPSHLVCLASLAVETALVVDVGYKEAIVMPVCHGMPIIQAWQALPLGGNTIHEKLRALLTYSNSGVQNLEESVIEDIKVRCCFVTKQARAKQLALAKPEITPCPDIKYPVGGSETLTIQGKIREKVFEVLYEEDNDHLCLSTMVLDALLAVNLDLRQKLAENVVFIGGTTMTPGFKSRFKEELIKQLQCDRYKKLKIKSFKFHSGPFKENYGAWLGGSIYGATELLAMKCLTKETYLKDQRVPDWVNLKDNIIEAA